MILENEVEKKEIDHNLYSRQIGAFGVEAMTKLVKLRVLQLGLSGVGIETAKNLILAGPRSLTIWDPTPVQPRDLEYNYYINEESLKSGKSRAQLLVPRLADLNGYVKVTEGTFGSLADIARPEVLKEFDVVVVAEWFDFEHIKAIDAFCNENEKGFVLALTAGLAGMIFADFGQHHRIFDGNGEEPAQVLISSITRDGIVTTHDDKRHDFVEGMIVRFKEVVGMEEINGQDLKIDQVFSPFSFSVGDLQGRVSGEYVRNGFAEEVKVPKELKFETLSQSIEDYQTEIPDCDMDFERLDRLGLTRFALAQIWKNHRRLDLLNENYVAELEGAISSRVPQHESTAGWNKYFESGFLKIIAAFVGGEYSPVHSLFGGIAAQEVVKFTGKFTPLKQWFVQEFYSTVLPDVKLKSLAARKAELASPLGQRYPSHVALLGAALQTKLMNSRVFMVGAGALGCEYLKMFAMIGLGCGPDGLLEVTDDDTIEVSNLNRQFLFRSQHVGQSKSETAICQAVAMNPTLKARALKSRVSPETETLFHDHFWESLSFIVNAVDNIKARQFVDRKAVMHYKALFEAGTLGTKCNSQLILPGLTESYNDSDDPKEKSVPMCTMRNFPFLIEHSIEWARGKFFDLFVQPSKFFREFFDDPERKSHELLNEMKASMNTVKELYENAHVFLPFITNPTPENYIKFARDFYQLAFDDQIANLLRCFPADHLDKDGNLFWTSPKRRPTALPFNPANLEHIDFIQTFIKVLQQAFVPLQPFAFSDAQLRSLLEQLPVSHRDSVLGAQDKEKLLAAEGAQEQASPSDEHIIKEFIAELRALASGNVRLAKINEVEFEKDDDSNGHIDLITYLTNYRATNYEIQNAPRHKIKLIAGRIIPAIATSTAMVVGANGVEIYKHLLDLPFARRRNFFSNLALPLFMFSEPSPPLVQKDKDFDPILLGPVITIPKNWNTWSRFEISGPMTLRQLNEKIRVEYGFTISTAAVGNFQLWNSFSKNLNHILDKPLEEAFEIIGVPRHPNKLYEMISISGENDDGVDVYCPVVKYRLA